LDAVLALDRPGMLTDFIALHEFAVGDRLDIGPFRAETVLLPHSVPNAGVRLTAHGTTVAYTGDSGPSVDVVTLARDADLFLVEASYVAEVPADSRQFLNSARTAGRQAVDAGARRLVLTHLMPVPTQEPQCSRPARHTRARSASPPPASSSTWCVSSGQRADESFIERQ
jgi:ribonuclease BN (tRNA processing enzyme)